MRACSHCLPCPAARSSPPPQTDRRRPAPLPRLCCPAPRPLRRHAVPRGRPGAGPLARPGARHAVDHGAGSSDGSEHPLVTCGWTCVGVHACNLLPAPAQSCSRAHLTAALPLPPCLLLLPARRYVAHRSTAVAAVRMCSATLLLAHAALDPEFYSGSLLKALAGSCAITLAVNAFRWRLRFRCGLGGFDAGPACSVCPPHGCQPQTAPRIPAVACAAPQQPPARVAGQAVPVLAGQRFPVLPPRPRRGGAAVAAGGDADPAGRGAAALGRGLPPGALGAQVGLGRSRESMSAARRPPPPARRCSHAAACAAPPAAAGSLCAGCCCSSAPWAPQCTAARPPQAGASSETCVRI